jgi:hypothetical protein
VRQLLAESLLLAMLGGALGLLLASGGLRLILALRPEEMRDLDGIRVDAWVLGYTLALAVVTGLLFGLLPAMRATRVSMHRALKNVTGVVGARGGQRFRNALVSIEVALSVILLVGAGLLVRSVQDLQSREPGFESENLVVFRPAVSQGHYAKPEQRTAFYRELLERVRRIPGVTGATPSTASCTARWRSTARRSTRMRSPPSSRPTSSSRTTSRSSVFGSWPGAVLPWRTRQ